MKHVRLLKNVLEGLLWARVCIYTCIHVCMFGYKTDPAGTDFDMGRYKTDPTGIGFDMGLPRSTSSMNRSL